MPPRVSYFYDSEVGSFFYGQEHPMKPFRIKMAHQLIVNYGLYRKMSVYVGASSAKGFLFLMVSHSYAGALVTDFASLQSVCSNRIAPATKR